MNIERMQPADFDAVYRLLTQSFPATERRGASAFTSGTASRSMRIMPTSSRRSCRAETRCRCTCSRPAAHARPASCAQWRRSCTHACTCRRPQRSNKGISARSCVSVQLRALLRYVSVMHPPAEPFIAKCEKALLLTAANRSLAANASSCSSRRKSTVSRSCSSSAAPCLHSPVS